MCSTGLQWRLSTSSTPPSTGSAGTTTTATATATTTGATSTATGLHPRSTPPTNNPHPAISCWMNCLPASPFIEFHISVHYVTRVDCISSHFISTNCPSRIKQMDDEIRCPFDPNITSVTFENLKTRVKSSFGMFWVYNI